MIRHVGQGVTMLEENYCQLNICNKKAPFQLKNVAKKNTVNQFSSMFSSQINH